MKTTSSRSWVGLSLAMAVGGTIALTPATSWAGDPPKPTKPQVPAKTSQATPVAQAALPKAKQPKEEVITGSLIPRKVKPDRAPATSGCPLVVLDRKAIDRSGASTVAEVLGRTVPSVR
jgi:hypothetical protein